jgi:hypothetical protein
MTDIALARDALVARLIEGEGVAPAAERAAAFANAGLAQSLDTLVGKVAEAATRITDADIAAVKAAGYSEDRIFELVICAAVGQAVRQHDSARAALAAARATA